MSAILAILLLVLLAVACGRATARGAGSRLKTALLALVCGTVALGCLVGVLSLFPCALEQLFPSPAPFLRASACPSFLSSGER